MKVFRGMLYMIVIAALFFVPLQRVEIANLEPVQAVWLCLEEENVVLETDTEDRGSGGTVAEALEDMKRKSPGIVYLDTAQYLFVKEPAQEQISALCPYMKRSTKVCRWDGRGSISDAVKCADAHKIGLKLKNWVASSKLPELPPLK